MQDMLLRMCHDFQGYPKTLQLFHHYSNSPKNDGLTRYGIVVRMFEVGEALVRKIHKNILRKVIFIKERNSFQANQCIAFIVKLWY